ncbi:MAG: S16 family serine protease [Akkermansiaceae bacterium]
MKYQTIIYFLTLVLSFQFISAKAPTSKVPSPTGATAKKLPIKIRQISINALLIREITKGNYGASVSKLTASVLPSDDIDQPMATQLNQDVGESMIKSFTAVNKGMFLKYDGWPKGENLTISFADKHGGKDGPSAAVAYSLLLESIFTGKELRQDLACTGDMNSDRTIQPIGGVVDKIRAAKNAGCNYILIPEKNIPAVMDAAIDGEIELLTSIQIISVKDLDQAVKVAFKDLDENTTKALAAYSKAQKIIASKGKLALKTSAVFKQIAITGKAMKNHQSALIAAYYKLNRMPKSYSVIGSFNRINKATAPFTRAKHSRGSVDKYAHSDPHKDAIRNIGKIQHNLHPEIAKFAVKIRTYITIHRKVLSVKHGINKDSPLHKQLKKALKELQQEEKKMLESPEIKDSLAE